SLFVGKRGAAVAIDPRTGGIIALVSKPDFDPAIFSKAVDQATWNYLNNSPEKPLYNRATMNLMPPGSTFKPFMALMALAEGLITLRGENSTVFCNGGHPVGRGRFFRCLGVHGPQNVRNAIKNSCNTFFFEMARRADVNTLKKYAGLFGFGVNAPTDIAEQTPGLIPDSAYFNQLDPNWDIGYSMNLGIGQGNMGVTPLQLARYIAAVANRGTLHAPHLVDYLRHPETGEIIRPDLPPPELIPIREEYFDVVRDGMRLVMEEGTGVLAQIPGIPSAGKTGTAQAPGGMEDHSVFVLFAPFDDPQIAIAVQAENAGEGAQAAAPIASLMAELYLKGELPDSYEVRFRMNRALNARSQPLPSRRRSSAPAPRPGA
ncbi:MAG: penicillin-binding transpeptidase domain-containing protein, partial [Rhodothermales bacterium]